MNKKFDIYSEIVDDGCKWVEQDTSPSDFRDFAEGLEAGDEVTLNINSVGGSVLAGVAIANQIKALNTKGVRTTAKIEGLCASIATVIMCACEKIILPSTSFVMIHNCWTMVQGDSNELRKQADVMDTMNDVIMSFYKTKFSLTEDELKAMMDAETWFSGEEAKNYNLNCEVVEDSQEYKIAASLKKHNFKNIPRGLTMKNVIEEEKVSAKAEETSTEKEEEKVEEKEEKEEKEETELERLTREIDELKKECEALKGKLAECEKPDEDEEKVTKAECEKRVYGMQQSMQKQINEYVDKVKEFEVQMEAKDKELTSYKNEIISLKDSLEKANGELQNTVSALEEKTKALDLLNANVNSRPDEEALPTLDEVQSKYRGNPEKIVEVIKSGKYIK